MYYCSTRNSENIVTSAQAILNGLSLEGGLFVPQTFPKVLVNDCLMLTYSELAEKIIALYLTDYEPKFLKKAVALAYGDKFDDKAGNTVKVADNLYSLELWHGPTCAFKDYALQLMPHLLCEAKNILNDKLVTKILVATSGDTGKAALDGYCNINGIKIAVFYPNNGTSDIQRLQMATQTGDNVSVYAVNGNFDDVQTSVKKAFVNNDLIKALLENGEKLSSANSINWGRLVPQIVYYFYCYCRLVQENQIKNGDKIDFCVPTGNFGDILAGYYAKQMGLPINKLICASNKNNVLSDFIKTGKYNAKRTFHKTSSPSMDILISSNLERLLYSIIGDSDKIDFLMQSLNEAGEFEVDKNTLDIIQDSFSCGWISDEDAAGEIKKQYTQNKYLCDPHTAVAFKLADNICKSYVSPCVVISTASPYKFSGDVLLALGEKPIGNEFNYMQSLNELTGLKIPSSLLSLGKQEIRFKDVIDASEIEKVAISI